MKSKPNNFNTETGDTPMRQRQSILSKIDFDNLTTQQFQEFLVHFAERECVMSAAENELIRRIEPTLGEAQKSIFAKFVQVMNDIDKASGAEIDRIAAMGTPPKVQ